ncbi:inverse autotransporter beta domain-containing protein [Campylobacter sp. MIT 21-1685]|uniref:inverse autotransporter beta domain-containing protein n=1 Tax=unclassified Campylobacter TaxID=2593542 RepID=UPI00224B1D52|nr:MULTISPECIES: inverse autotransporter beta domain-containing protein [unclassified Campylobacter]MCX2682427.1 inverse autotransporter beta domain-containing protein [Campylobacter sp. MIT 21-1684]MCX2750707.1 inverse autotransporter beta domain-containing protein [Campylobacter sp. MIT 21-1682]MCX2806745.1 inverse autotransporter beta domain-containing protein [Campylobacter sp. MIT 21-1685]
MKLFFVFFVFFSFLNANPAQQHSNAWKHFDFNSTKEVPKPQDEEVDFKKYFNSIIANTLESENGIDQSDSNVDFENKNIQIKNLKSLYEGENNSLFFQRELFVAQDTYNYSIGLVDRYEKDQFIFGINSFIDKRKENNENKSIGSEFVYSRYIKIYSNYYIPKEEDRILQFGINFIFPQYRSFIFGVSSDNQKTNYKISYSPYDVFSLVLLHRNFKQHDDDSAIEIGFHFKLDSNFIRQFKSKDNSLEEVDRYDFLQRMD